MAFALGFALWPSIASADDGFTIAAVQTAIAPKLDGTLDDAAWKNAARVHLGWDLTFARPAAEQTDVYVLADSRFLYVGFDARQREAMTATQHVDDAGLATDDMVRIILWPDGPTGFQYSFASNPLGTRYAQSSENTSFAPSWTTVAKRTAYGYTVTARIPLDVMRAGGSATWRVQFSRRIMLNSGQTLEWAHVPAQDHDDVPNYAGYLSGMSFASSVTRTKPRATVYALTQAGSGANGFNSRSGLDLAIPITSTSSFLATVHPDYSNVELDQQTISPTAFQRQYQEVRPFFTQGAGFYNLFDCDDCVDFPLVYTPAIPTPKIGYAVEGVQGPLMFAGFTAQSDGRDDAAQTVNYRSADRRYNAMVLRSTVDTSSVHDDTTWAQTKLSNGHNFNVYATLGSDHTLASGSHDGQYREYSANLYSPKAWIYAAYHDVGMFYAPVDGFIQINDIKGPSLTASREIDFSARAFVQSIIFTQDYQRYQNHLGQLAQGTNSSSLVVNTRNRLSFSVSSGSQYLRLPTTPGGWANQNGFIATYGANTGLPTTLGVGVGQFGAGYLHSFVRLTSFRVSRATVALEMDDTVQTLSAGARNVQWLERASVTYPIDAASSVALGIRRIIGLAPSFFTAVPPADASNISAAYYLRKGPGELYLVYGDSNAVVTTPRVLLKYVLYIGAQKGT